MTTLADAITRRLAEREHTAGQARPDRDALRAAVAHDLAIQRRPVAATEQEQQ